MIRIFEQLSTAPGSMARKPGAIVVFGAYEYFDLTGYDTVPLDPLQQIQSILAAADVAVDANEGTDYDREVPASGEILYGLAVHRR